MLPLKTYERSADGDDRKRVRADDSSLAELLFNPVPGKMSTMDLVEFIESDLGIYNQAAAVLSRPQIGAEPDAIIPLSWERLHRHNQRWLYMVPGEGSYELRGEDIVFWKYYRGVSPIETLADTLRLEYHAKTYSAASFENGVRPSGALIVPSIKSEEQQKDLQMMLDSRHAGSANNFRALVLTGDADWKSFNHTAKDAELVGLRMLNRNECATAWRIAPPLIGILDNATYCLPGRVPVFTEDGPRSIADVRPGDRVWSLGENGPQLQPVTACAESGTDEILKIRTTNRTLYSNERHRVLVRRRVETTGDVRPNRWRYKIEHAYVPAGELRVGDVVVTLASTEHGTGSHSDASVGLMELFGLYLGDGNLTKRTDGQPTGFCISRAASATYMDHYRDIMRREFRQRGGREITVQEQERATRVSSVAAGRMLVDLGFGGTAHTKRVPGWVFGATEEQKLAFLRGFVDADGSVDKKGRISVHSCNEWLLHDLRHLFMSLGVPVTNVRNQVGRVKLPNGEMFDSSMWAFTASDPGANRRIGSNTPEDARRIVDGKPFGRKDRKYPLNTSGRVSEPPPGCAYSKIAGIDRLPSEPVYDLQVDGTENFIADGVVVHNSNIDTQYKMHFRITLGPRIKKFEETLRVQLIQREPRWRTKRLFAEFDMDAVLRASLAERAEAYTKMIQVGYTINGIRKLENMPALEHPLADTAFFPVNLRPVSDQAFELGGTPTDGRNPMGEDDIKNLVGEVLDGRVPVKSVSFDSSLLEAKVDAISEREPVTVNVTLPEIHNHVAKASHPARARSRREADGTMVVEYEQE